MKNLKSQSLVTLCLLALMSAIACQAQQQSLPATQTQQAVASASPAQQKSPAGSTEIAIDGKKVTINYHRPSMKGRKIFGGLVPYGQVWRTGANNATSLKTEVDLMFGKTVVPAGSYTLYSLPTEQGWKLIINKQTGQWGTQYDESQDLARVDLKVSKLSTAAEQFTITLEANKGGGTLKMEWENTAGSVDFTVKK